MEFINTLSDYFKDIKNTRKEEDLNKSLSNKDILKTLDYIELTKSDFRLNYPKYHSFDTPAVRQALIDSLVTLGYPVQKARQFVLSIPAFRK